MKTVVEVHKTCYQAKAGEHDGEAVIDRPSELEIDLNLPGEDHTFTVPILVPDAASPDGEIYASALPDDFLIWEDADGNVHTERPETLYEKEPHYEGSGQFGDVQACYGQFCQSPSCYEKRELQTPGPCEGAKGCENSYEKRETRAPGLCEGANGCPNGKHKGSFCNCIDKREIQAPGPCEGAKGCPPGC
ncbi:hypothetical protein F53441_5479 [Fusarium austroafricanum]|uniref:Uncharacterized protein n=1 Tax=Fusarium austroafricanum TaxID=2364996 RepID=A0A8H4NZN4_9HYPO|nr:hypothetical protein F53441_5479 [Fusarium austroafricanum]